MNERPKSVTSCYAGLAPLKLQRSRSTLLMKWQLYFNNLKKEKYIEREYLDVALKYFENRHFREAEYYFQKAAKIFPENYELLAILYYYIGECFFMQERYEESKDKYQKAIGLNPILKDPYYRMGECFLIQGRYKEAMSWYQKAIKLKPDWEQPYDGIAECFLMEGETEKAKRWYRKVIKLKPDWETPYYHIGLCLLRQDRYEESKIWYQKAIELKPEWEKPYFGKGECLRMQGKYEESKTAYQKAVELNPEDEYSYDGIGECFRMLGQYENAKKYFFLAIQKNEKFSQPYFNLSILPASAFGENEMYGQPYFNRFLILWILWSRDYVLNVSALKECLSYDAPLLVFLIFKKLGDHFIEGLYAFPNLLEVVSMTEPFRKQFALWALGRKSPKSSWTVEALLNYYCGNPIRAYEIFDNELEDSLENPLSPLNQYYFALSAKNILEDHEGCLKNFALPQSRATLLNISSSFTDKYYAALILEIAGYTDEATSVLFYLKNKDFVPARYKWAELKRKEYANDIDYEREIIGDLLIQMNLEVNYYRFPEKVILNEDDDKMLHDLMPLIHFMENREVLETIYSYQKNHQIEFSENPFDNKSFFASKIVFSHLEEDKVADYIETKHPHVFESVFGSDEERELLQPEINYYADIKKVGRTPSYELGNKIHVSSYANYDYLKKNLRNPPEKFNYRHHLLLVSNLKDKKIIDNDESCLLHEYIKFCFEKIYILTPENEFLEIPLNEIKEHISLALNCGVGYHAVEAAIKFGFHKIKGKQSEVISFNEFVDIVVSKKINEI
jgi:tetratricopeptide (TPR) repeat protein